jgi:hypothetical protein
VVGVTRLGPAGDGGDYAIDDNRLAWKGGPGLAGDHQDRQVVDHEVSALIGQGDAGKADQRTRLVGALPRAQAQPWLLLVLRRSTESCEVGHGAESISEVVWHAVSHSGWTPRRFSDRNKPAWPWPLLLLR